jgi:predicted permease
LLVAPAIVVGLAMVMGVRGPPLGVLFLLVGAPAAASGYIMVVAAKGNGVLAANIVVLSTLFSAASLTLGLFLLSLFSLVGQIGGEIGEISSYSCFCDDVPCLIVAN